MNASQKAKAAGFKNLNEVVSITGESRQNLNNMNNNRPLRYECLIKGAMVKKLEEIK